MVRGRHVCWPRYGRRSIFRAVSEAVDVAAAVDLTLAVAFADRVVVLDQGCVVADDAPVSALSPAILRQVFGLDGQWIDGPDGPLLAARRAQ